MIKWASEGDDMRKHLEDDMQEMVITWCRLNESKYPKLENIFAIPNGGKRDIREAARFKRQGVKPGVPDLFLPTTFLFESVDGTIGMLHGLFIEMKAGKNKLTEKQLQFHMKLTSVGYRVRTCYSFEEAVKEICDYLDIPYKM